MMTFDLDALRQGAIRIASKAGERIMEWYQRDVSVADKADGSPLTEADRAAHTLITAALKEMGDAIPVVSEEDECRCELGKTEFFWLVDPLDGTKEFLKRSGEFTVNIALVQSGRPVLGVVHAPEINLTYSAVVDWGAWRRQGDGPHERIASRPVRKERPSIVASKDHAGPQVRAFVEKFADVELRSMGSSLKFCLVAEGSADFYLRDVPTMEWDTAAAQCIVDCAGGGVFTLDGCELAYGKSGFKNPTLMTVGDRTFDWSSLL